MLRSTRATSAACRQPDMRPDLEPLRVEVLPGADADTRRYRVVVRNAGRTDAGAVRRRARRRVRARHRAWRPGAQQAVTLRRPGVRRRDAA